MNGDPTNSPPRTDPAVSWADFGRQVLAAHHRNGLGAQCVCGSLMCYCPVIAAAQHHGLATDDPAAAPTPGIPRYRGVTFSSMEIPMLNVGNPPVTDIHDHYTVRYDEATRLCSTVKGRLERARVRDVLSWYLPAAPAAVVDVGGGTGVHAAWLQSRGYAVELLDPVQTHVEQATEAGISSVVGDARCLPWPDRSFDAALLAGPLYHLIEATDRHLALREAARVLRPGGVVAAVAINRFANLFGATLANQLGERRCIVEEILADGYSPRNDRMAGTYYHTVDALHAELTAAGAGHVTVHGLTGPGGWLAVAIDRHVQTDALPDTLTNADPLQTALDGARLADRYPDLVPASALLMAVGYRD